MFSPEGNLLLRLERGIWFNAPWGLVQASTDFGTFSHSIIVGQFGSGEILAFDPVTGQFQGKLEDQNSNVISIPALWGLAFGAGNANSGAPNQLFFNAGIDQEKGGLFGFFFTGRCRSNPRERSVIQRGRQERRERGQI